MHSAPENPAGARPRRPRALFAVLALGVALRLGILALQSEHLQHDTDAYLAIAGQFASGNGFAGIGGSPTAYRPPLYPLLLAAVLALGGGTTAIGVVQVVLGALTVWLAYEIGRKLVPGRGALIASGIVAVDPLLVQYTVFTMTEVLCAFLVSLLLLVSYSRIEARRHLLVGVVFGLSALARPTMWSFGGLVLMYWIVARVVRHRGFLKGRLTGTVREVPWGLLIGTAVIVAPWGVRNLVVFGKPILTTTHGGYTLLLGNNPVFYREVVAAPWGTTWSHQSREAWRSSLDRKMAAHDPPIVSETEADAWMYRQARENITAEPGLFVRSCWLRFRRFWNIVPLEAAVEPIRGAWMQLCGRAGSEEWCGSTANGVVASVRWGVGGFYVLVTGGMVAGLVRLGRAEWRRWMPLVLLIASFTLVHLFYWSNTRMRAPLVPVIALLAARGVSSRQELSPRTEPTAK